MSHLRLLLLHIPTGNLTGNIYANNYLLQSTGLFEFVGIWYIQIGRRPAIASAFLIASALSLALIAFYAAGK